MKNKQQVFYSVSKAVIYGQLMLEALDDVKELPMFKQSLRFKVNQAEKQLEKELEKYIIAFANEDESFYMNIQNHIDNLVSKLSSLSLEELPLVGKIIDEYIEDKDHWKENLVLQFKQLNS
tara:strand:+ start:226 stop:588 length:363 start_codon:yes stop_codon:yes gene_type:complete